MARLGRRCGWTYDALSLYEIGCIVYTTAQTPFTVDTLWRDSFDILKKKGIRKEDLRTLIGEGVKKGIFEEVRSGHYDVVDLKELFLYSATTSAIDTTLRNEIVPTTDHALPLRVEAPREGIRGELPESMTLPNASEIVLPLMGSDLPVEIRLVESSAELKKDFLREKSMVTFLSRQSILSLAKDVGYDTLRNYRVATASLRVESLYGEILVPGEGYVEEVIAGSPKSLSFLQSLDGVRVVETSVKGALYSTIMAYKRETGVRSILRSPVTHCWALMKSFVSLRPLEKYCDLYVVFHDNVDVRIVYKTVERVASGLRDFDVKLLNYDEPSFHKFVDMLEALTAEGLVICLECGNVIPAGIEYCPFCGIVRRRDALELRRPRSASRGGIYSPPLRIADIQGVYATCDYCQENPAKWKVLYPWREIRLTCEQCYREYILSQRRDITRRKCDGCGKIVSHFKRREGETLCRECYAEKYWREVKVYIESMLEILSERADVLKGEEIFNVLKKIFNYIISHYFYRKERTPSVLLLAEEVLGIYFREYNVPVPFEEIVKIVRGLEDDDVGKIKRREKELKKRVNAMLRRMYTKGAFTRRDAVAGLRRICFRHK